MIKKYIAKAIAGHLTKQYEKDPAMITGLLTASKCSNRECDIVCDENGLTTFIGVLNGLTWPYVIAREYDENANLIRVVWFKQP